MFAETLMKHGIHHVGFVVRDIDEALKKFEGDYGITEFSVYDFVPNKVWSYGELIHGYKLKLAMLNAGGGCTMELIQPVEGKALHSDFLEQGNKGFHHVCFSTDRFDDWKEKIRSQNKAILFECETEDDKIGYRRGLFTKDEDLDLMLEIREIPYFRNK